MACKRTFQLNKLVRDEIVGIYQANGGVVDYDSLNSDEPYRALLDKLDEEVSEVKSATAPEDIAKEIADVRSLLDVFAELKEIPQADIQARINERLQSVGGFSKGRHIKTVALPADNKWAQCHAAEPDRFP